MQCLLFTSESSLLPRISKSETHGIHKMETVAQIQQQLTSVECGIH